MLLTDIDKDDKLNGLMEVKVNIVSVVSGTEPTSEFISPPCAQYS